jgi:hypothetical protein
MVPASKIPRVEQSNLMADRSYERISKVDLRRLARIADEERNDLFARRPDWRLLYRRRLLCTVLHGQSALHYCNGTSGIDQFDVCLFFAAHAEAPFPHHWSSYRDFGKSKFGRRNADRGYTGRRVHFTGRSLACRPSDDPIAVLQAYLRGGRSPTARHIRDGAAVLIAPESYLGYVAWPTLVA